MVSFQEANDGGGGGNMKIGWLVGVAALGLLVACGSGSVGSDGGLGGSGGRARAGGAAPGLGGAGGATLPNSPRPNITTGTSSPDAGTSTSTNLGTKTGARADGGTAPTFTQLYNDILLVSCSGGACHNPGMQKGVSFATQSLAYISVRNRVLPG